MLPGGLGQESAAAALVSGKTQPRSAEKSANRRAKTYLHRNRNSWGWGGGGGNFRRYGCVGYPAVPFAQGPLEVVSANLARRIARDPAISAFVAHARTHGGSGGRAWAQHEYNTITA